MRNTLDIFTTFFLLNVCALLCQPLHYIKPYLQQFSAPSKGAIVMKLVNTSAPNHQKKHNI